MIDVLYFAWLRERIGVPKEAVETSASIVEELIVELREKSEAHQLAFSDVSAVRVAVDQELTDFSASLAGAREVAFFPPMTGG